MTIVDEQIEDWNNLISLLKDNSNNCFHSLYILCGSDFGTGITVGDVKSTFPRMERDENGNFALVAPDICIALNRVYEDGYVNINTKDRFLNSFNEYLSKLSDDTLFSKEIFDDYITQEYNKIINKGISL